jgi:DNA-directed RNA polymerase specialized sigma24 family protein
MTKNTEPTVAEPKAVKIKPKRKKNYLNNADLLIELEKSRDQDKMTEKLAHMLQTLAARYASQGNFAGYTYVEDMKAYAMFMVCRTWHRFDPAKSKNPFAFFTQCIKHSYYQFLNKEKRQRVIRDELLVYSGLNPSNTYLSDYEQDQMDNRSDDMGDFDVMEDVDDDDIDNIVQTAMNDTTD